MALVRDSDTSLWLHNKLGTSNDLWSGGSICSQLNQDVLRNIRDCFIDLQSQVKLKLLLSILHIPRRNVEEWRLDLEEVLEVASADGDQWVSMLAELLKSYPGTGNLNFQIQENAQVFSDLINEVKKIVKKHAEQSILPLECLYLNRPAFGAVVGHIPQLPKHFALKRKPKSAALKAELLQKSLDAASNMKRNSGSSTVPIRCRGLNKSMAEQGKVSPLAKGGAHLGFRSPQAGRLGVPVTANRSRSTPAKKDGGVKLLEMHEQPMGYGREAKRRKKLQESEGPESKKERETPLGQPGVALEGTTPTTPDYAAGLLATPTQLPSTPSVVVANATPTLAPCTPVVPPVGGGLNYAATGHTLSAVIGGTTPGAVKVLSTVQAAEPLPALQPQTASVQQQPVQQALATPQASPLVTAPLVRVAPTVVSQAIAQQRLTTTQSVQAPAQHLGGIMHPTHIQQQQQPQQQTLVTAQPQKKEWFLTKDQMTEAQEMFKNSNKVTRPEKALILGFMAGSRENPCPQLGNIVNIKLSEGQEEVVMQNGHQLVMVETHFQMNYLTGEWKRVKKYMKVPSQ